MSRFPIIAVGAIALAAITAFFAPAIAGAAITTEVSDGRLLVVGDEEDNSIVLSVFAEKIAVNSAVTAQKADASAEVVVVGGDGDDLVDASALAAGSYERVSLIGSKGDDRLTGGGGVDFLGGESGNDRLAGGKGKDELLGGDGDDLLVWNNGDGSDLDLGEQGSDEVLVTGDPTAGDRITFAPAGEPGAVQLQRTNLNQFSVGLEAERLTIDGLGGADEIGPDPAAAGGIAGRTTVTVDGGEGDDSLSAGDGGDRIAGGTGEDVLIGGPLGDNLSGGDSADFIDGEGGDRVTGDRGSDVMLGGDGDDALVWNNGDGSDVEDGGVGFDTAAVNGSPAGGDTFSLAPEGGSTVFTRTNLVPFTITFGSIAALTATADSGRIEAVSVDGAGGDDTLTVAPGLPDLRVAAEGGAGDDRLAGAEEADTLFGGVGNDLLSPGSGSDLADGGEGNDRIEARDGRGDLVRGGAGTDSAVVDALTVDAVDGVESIDATPAPAAPAPPAAKVVDQRAALPTLGRIAVQGRPGKPTVRIPLSCPAGESGGCVTAVTLQTVAPVRLGAVDASIVLGAGRIVLAGGQAGTATVRLAPGAAGLARHGRLRARLRIESSDAAGNSSSRSVTVELRITHA